MDMADPRNITVGMEKGSENRRAFHLASHTGEEIYDKWNGFFGDQIQQSTQF
jgi:hypothetical protein